MKGNKKNRFGLIGTAGYIVPRHLAAIKAVGGELAAAMDKVDNAGALDKYFPDTAFFCTFEEFIEHIYLCKQHNHSLDYISICSPNYLHRAHITYALTNNMNAICEKPLTLKHEDLNQIKEIEAKTGKSVYSILQLRLHPAIRALKEKVDKTKSSFKHEIDLSYITFRGPWYYKSWKSNEDLSGGILMNLGVHFFDLLLWIFGKPLSFEMHVKSASTYAGYLELEKAKIKWIMSLDKKFLPSEIIQKSQFTYRSLVIDGEEFEFSNVENDLHTEIYKDIVLNNNGFKTTDVEGAIQLINDLQKKEVSSISNNRHSLLAFL